MKLSTLVEDNFLKAITKSIGKTYFQRPGLHTMQPQSSGARGIDAGSRAGGFNFMTTGVPRKGRHRRFFSITPPNAL